MSAMGVRNGHFNVTICNSFQTKIINDQLCYEVDLNTFSDKNNIEKELKIGLNFLIDYNDDRQVTFEQNVKQKELGLGNSVTASYDLGFVYLDTIGKGSKL